MSKAVLVRGAFAIQCNSPDPPVWLTKARLRELSKGGVARERAHLMGRAAQAAASWVGAAAPGFGMEVANDLKLRCQLRSYIKCQRRLSPPIHNSYTMELTPWSMNPLQSTGLGTDSGISMGGLVCIGIPLHLEV